MGLCHFKRLKTADNEQDELDHYCINYTEADQFSTLPAEILEIIFSHLSPKFLMQNVLPACWRFRQILSDEKWWIQQIRTHRLKIRLCEAELGNAEFSPARTFHSILREEKIRKNWSKQKRSVIATGDNVIDSVKLFRSSGQKFCLTASSTFPQPTRISLWNMDSEDTNQESQLLDQVRVEHDFDGHPRCSLEMYGTEKFLCGARDETLKLWDIGQAGIRERCRKNLAYSTVILSLQHGLLACRREHRSISLFDVENGLQEVGRSVVLPVLNYESLITTITLKGNTIYTLFSDQLMTLDVRKLTGPVHQHSFGDLTFTETIGPFAFPAKHLYNSMSVVDGVIHCSHTGGKISVLQASDLTPCYSFCVSSDCREKQDLRRVVKTTGSVLACSSHAVRAFSLGTQPEYLGVYYEDLGLDSALDVLHEDVVVGGKGMLTYWTSDHE